MYNKDRISLEEQYKKIVEGQFGVGGESITKVQLIDKIKEAEASHKGTNFFSVTQVTKETTNKAPVPSFVLPGLKNGKTYFAKVSQVNVQVGYDYSNSVNKQREREGKVTDFVAKPSIYTSMTDSNVLVTKDEQVYIRYRPIQVSASSKPVLIKAIVESPTTPNDFAVVSKQEVDQYKGSSIKAGSYQGVADGVEVRTISLDSVVSANIAGKSYVISDLDPLRKSIYQASTGPAPAQLPV